MPIKYSGDRPTKLMCAPNLQHVNSKHLKNIQVNSLVFSKLRVYIQFCSVLCLEKRRSLVFIYQILDSTDFSKNQLKTWHFLIV